MAKSKSFINHFIKAFKFGSSREGDIEEDLEKLTAQEQKQFSFDTLVAATRNFHPNQKLGEGGFGPVFKGKLDNGRDIAVKKLSQSSNQGSKEFINEAKLLAKVQHRNVVNLLGYCVNGDDKLLVYEYVSNESLDKLLFKYNRSVTLNWSKRFEIICGVARGLLYLHEDSPKVIIHRDIKASNILLDDKWVPKIADFGLARLFPGDQTHINTRVAGTNGYMAPEYMMHGHLSMRADVFSFGVVVLELISGQKNSLFSSFTDGDNLLYWAYKLYKESKSMEIVDPTLAESALPDQVAMCIQIGLLCVQNNVQLRPTMGRVVVMLSKKHGNMDEPTRPGVLSSRFRRVQRRGRGSKTLTDSHSNLSDSSSTNNANALSAHASTSSSEHASGHASTSSSGHAPTSSTSSFVHASISSSRHASTSSSSHGSKAHTSSSSYARPSMSLSVRASTLTSESIYPSSLELLPIDAKRGTRGKLPIQL